MIFNFDLDIDNLVGLCLFGYWLICVLVCQFVSQSVFSFFFLLCFALFFFVLFVCGWYFSDEFVFRQQSVSTPASLPQEPVLLPQEPVLLHGRYQEGDQEHIHYNSSDHWAAEAEDPGAEGDKGEKLDVVKFIFIYQLSEIQTL